MNEQDLAALKTAVTLLENPSFLIRVAGFVGLPIEKSIGLLPHKASHSISTAVQKAIHSALKLSIKTLGHQGPGSPPAASNWWHMAAVASSGAIGGAFGWLALTVELPVSTAIIMRSIADVARSEGADIADLATQLECVQILALGGPSSGDNAAETGYFFAREAMARAVTEAATHIVKHGLEKEAAPAILRLITAIAQRYSIVVTEKVAAQLVPIVGAAGGAVINTVFIDHFQNIARGHFTLLRLENTYGTELVQQKYRELKAIKRS